MACCTKLLQQWGFVAILYIDLTYFESFKSRDSCCQDWPDALIKVGVVHLEIFSILVFMLDRAM